MGFRNLITHLLAAPKPFGEGGRPAPALKTSAAGPVIAWSHVGQPRWTPRRFEALAEQGFRKNVIAYRCVMQVATASAAIPWLLYDSEDGELDRHPLLDLLRHPNPLQDGTAFLESVYAYLEIAGNAYIEAVTPRDGDAPVELYVLRPDRMKVIPGRTGLPQGYQYTVNGQVTTWTADPLTGASNILHLKQFHPLDDWYGMAPLEAAQVSVDQHNAAGSWNQALLSHGARPSGALVFAPKDGPSSLTDDQLHRLREELGQVYQGSSNAGRPLILEGGLDWREMSLSPKDMDWLAGRNTAARDIALAFGVPAQLVGIPDAQTYANMAEARMALYEETVLPLVNRVIAGFDHWLTPIYGQDIELDYDADEVSALAVRRDTQWNKLQTTDFLTINEKRHAVGYGPIEGGDVLDSANKKPGATGNAPITSAQTPGSAPATGPQSPFPPAPNVLPNAWSGEPKFNPYHDPDNGQFTTGPHVGDDDDNGDDDGEDSGGDNTPATPMDSHPGSRFFPGVDTPAKPDQGTRINDTPSASDTWGNPNTLEDHWKRHGDDFNAELEADYAEQANQFYQALHQEQIPSVKNPDGVIRMYDPDTNTFGSYNPDGTTKTFLKPPDGLAYFQEQIDKDLAAGGHIIYPLPQEGENSGGGDSNGGSGGGGFYKPTGKPGDANFNPLDEIEE